MNEEGSGQRPRVSRDEKTLEVFFRIFYENLKNCYEKILIKNDPSVLSFNDFATIVGAAVPVNEEDPFEMISKAFASFDVAQDERELANGAIGPIVVALIYAARALGEQVKGESDKAWSYMTDASYWTGVVVSGKGLKDIRLKERKSLAAAGGNKKSAKYEEARKHAYSLCRERKPSPMWKSRNNAAISIADDVNRYIAEFLKLEQVSSETVYDWLGKMSDADQIFAKPRSVKD